MRNIKFLLPIAFMLVTVLFQGCQFDYEESMMAEDLAEEVPDTVLRSFSQVMVRDSSPRFYIRAEESLSYGKRKETIFRGIHFQEYDENGIVVTDGRADNAKLYNETESVELWGSLNFYSQRKRPPLRVNIFTGTMKNQPFRAEKMIKSVLLKLKVP